MVATGCAGAMWAVGLLLIIAALQKLPHVSLRKPQCIGLGRVREHGIVAAIGMTEMAVGVTVLLAAATLIVAGLCAALSASFLAHAAIRNSATRTCGCVLASRPAKPGTKLAAVVRAAVITGVSLLNLICVMVDSTLSEGLTGRFTSAGVFVVILSLLTMMAERPDSAARAPGLWRLYARAAMQRSVVAAETTGGREFVVRIRLRSRGDGWCAELARRAPVWRLGRHQCVSGPSPVRQFVAAKREAAPFVFVRDVRSDRRSSEDRAGIFHERRAATDSTGMRV